ncbi:MAG: sulfite exporter TauE/SafE family protein [Deltaproteobacteria bacterium]|nr:sulfite exporter TauE/SafE family protein [Deltaproteobacteria bacterium]
MANMHMAFLLPAVFLIAVFMTMAGRGGGNFYVLLQVLAGASMHLAASTGQLIMCFTSLAALIVFQKHKNVAWRMALFLGLTASLTAFFGGLLAHFFAGTVLKLVFACLLVLASFLMLYPVSESTSSVPKSGHWSFESGEVTIHVNLWLAAPFAIATGFFAGMVGVSGGSFLIPLMVLACRMPMKLAVGTASVMVGATAGMGFLGHVVESGIEWSWAVPQVAVALIGGLLGGKLALKTKPKVLKSIFALTTLAAAIFMYVNALV